MNLNTQIDLIEKAIDALIDVEPVVGSPAIAETLRRLNQRAMSRRDELEATACDCPHGGGVEFDREYI